MAVITLQVPLLPGLIMNPAITKTFETADKCNKMNYKSHACGICNSYFLQA